MTISPVFFFWQAEEEVETERANLKEEPLRRSRLSSRQLFRIRVDTYTVHVSELDRSLFIILTAAATLNRHNITDINTAQDAAKALEPIAGRFAFYLFSLGTIGTGMLAVPVLAGSAAYAVGEALWIFVGFNRSLLHARGFYAIFTAATLIGLGMNFVHIDPIKALSVGRTEWCCRGADHALHDADGVESEGDVAVHDWGRRSCFRLTHVVMHRGGVLLVTWGNKRSQ